MTFTQRLRARLNESQELGARLYLQPRDALALVEVLEAAAMDCECAGHMRQLRDALARLDKEEGP